MAKRPIAFAAVKMLVLTCILGACLSGKGRADDLRETPLVRAVKRALHSAVNIHSEKTSYANDSAFASSTKKPKKINGMGTGIIIDERGYIVTNHHVVNGVESLRCTLDNGDTHNAVVISEDPVRDLAILKIQPTTPLTVMPMGTSSDLMPAETVFAVGNAFGYENTVTLGIISTLARDVEVNETQSYKNLIQTDASINPGNSGGPLINLNGELIGINVAIRAGAQRIGFAIPIDDARKIIAELLRIEHFDGTFHGLVTADVKHATDRRLVVESSRSGSPAEIAGFKTGDVVVKVGNTSVIDGVDFERALLGHRPGDEMPVVVRRGDATQTISLKLAATNGLPAASGNIVVHNEGDPLSQRIWESLGIRVSKILRSSTVLVDSKYEGGLQVLAVRPGSPAAKCGIQQKDILVGLEKYKTLKPEEVSWVLDHREANAGSPLLFYIVRSADLMWGHMELSVQQAQLPATQPTLTR